MKPPREQLIELESSSLGRSLHLVSSRQGAARLSIDSQVLLNFSSNNYLGLANHPQVVAAAQRALHEWGAGATASRLISGTCTLHRDLEKQLADFLQKDAALLFPSGYMANLGIVTTLVGRGDAVLVDRLCHASIIDAVRLSGARLFVYRHADVAHAEAVMRRTARYARRLLVTESLFSMDGDFASLRRLSELCRTHGVMSMVDEAHAIGVWGYHGRGVLGMEGMDAPWDIVVGTLSKALGSQGGFVGASQDVIDLLINKARPFIFTTGLSPVCVAAGQAALSLVQEDASPRVKLQPLSARLRDGLRLQGWDIGGSTSQIVPIMLGSAQEALRCAAHLLRHGLYAPAIRPPTVPARRCRIRFSVTADHRDADVDALLNALVLFREAR